MARYSFCIVPPEQHYNTCRELYDDLKYYEGRRSKFYTDHPQFAPPQSKFEQVRDPNDSKFLLFPTAMDYGVLYRGQSDFYKNCLPTICRKERTEDELFVERVQIAEFRLLLEQYEVTRRFEANNFFIDYVGLAQHYGLNTDVLDITSDIEVALFFAMCDCKDDVYYPKSEDKEYIGYLYAVLPNTGPKQEGNMFSAFSNDIKVIGLQPFKRPGRQKGFSYHMDKNGLVNGYLYSFNYNKKDSEMIYAYFNQGTDLWCKDEIAEYAKHIRDTDIFSNRAIKIAIKMFGGFSSVNKAVNRLRLMGYKIVGERHLDWADVGTACSEEEWLGIRNDIFARRYISGNTEHYCITTSHIGEQISIYQMYGSTDAPKGYNSGHEFSLDENGVICIANSFHHQHLIPDMKGDMKIHPEWKNIKEKAPKERSFEIPYFLRPRLVYVKRS